MSKRCQCVGKKMALLVLRSVGLCIGQNQMCHFVRLAFLVVFLSVYGCSVGRHRVATNVLRLGTVATDYFDFHLSFPTPLCLGAVMGCLLSWGMKLQKFIYSNYFLTLNIVCFSANYYFSYTIVAYAISTIVKRKIIELPISPIRLNILERFSSVLYLKPV